MKYVKDALDEKAKKTFTLKIEIEPEEGSVEIEAVPQGAPDTAEVEGALEQGDAGFQMPDRKLSIDEKAKMAMKKDEMKKQKGKKV